MMTGQLLGGQNPTRAAWYQIIIMCLIMGAVFVSVSITIELVIWNAFDDSGALRDDWIVDNDSLRVSQFISSLWIMSASSLSQGGIIGERFSTNEVKATTPELLAVELSVKGNETKKLPDGGTSPLFQIDINGSYADGKRTMAASFVMTKGVTILQGESGIGKSTLLKSIAMQNSGFTPSSLSNSTVKLNGKDRESFHPTQWRKQVLYIPQHGSSALQGTPESFLNFIASSHHHKNSSTTSVLESLKSQTINYMEQWKVTSPASKLTQPWSQLSGGEAQRILLSIALSTQPKILLLDEPTSALDLPAKLALEQSLKDSAENGLIIVLVTHDEDQMNRLGTMFLSLDVV
jgi:ABC-type multidrug transport system ATPase subunit